MMTQTKRGDQMGDLASNLTSDFWRIISEANRQPQLLRSILAGLSQQELEAFHKDFDYAIDDLLSEIEDSDTFSESMDTAKGIAGWVVSQGYDFYSNILNNPGAFPAEQDVDYSQSFFGVVNIVYEERFNRQIP